MLNAAVISPQPMTRIAMQREAMDHPEHGVRIGTVATTVPQFLAQGGTEPTVVLLSMRTEDGRTLAQNVADLVAHEHTVVMLTAPAEVLRVRSALAFGASGAVCKCESLRTVFRTLRLTRQLGHFLSDRIQVALADLPSRAPAKLSRREREVLGLYVDGMQEQEVAAELHIAESTVEEHLKRIRRKYALVERPARTKLELYKRAVEDGIIPPVLPLA
ncbi:helix-turn-helix transcriptional regulator [Kocuria dechangensis]|jgi:DNA-binding NarL/FixJ family response regulator|nr:response regulator transcription factor [Kocuria dechangensis]